MNKMKNLLKNETPLNSMFNVNYLHEIFSLGSEAFINKLEAEEPIEIDEMQIDMLYQSL
jgi:hypothetical protein